MKTKKKSKTKSVKPVFEDLGFSPSESAAMKIKADLYFAIQDIIKIKGYKSRQLEKILDQPQPRVSELINGKISKVSIEKLINYLELLGENTKLKILVGKQAS